MPAESPMKDHPLGIASRYNDAECEEHGFKEVIQRQGLEFSDVMYAAEQRAIRILWIALDRDLAIFKEPGFIVLPRLTMAERRSLVTYQSAELDGMMIGWRAANLESSDRASKG